MLSLLTTILAFLARFNYKPILVSIAKLILARLLAFIIPSSSSYFGLIVGFVFNSLLILADSVEYIVCYRALCNGKRRFYALANIVIMHTVSFILYNSAIVRSLFVNCVVFFTGLILPVWINYLVRIAAHLFFANCVKYIVRYAYPKFVNVDTLVYLLLAIEFVWTKLLSFYVYLHDIVVDIDMFKYINVQYLEDIKDFNKDKLKHVKTKVSNFIFATSDYMEYYSNAIVSEIENFKYDMILNKVADIDKHYSLNFIASHWNTDNLDYRKTYRRKLVDKNVYKSKKSVKKHNKNTIERPVKKTEPKFVDTVPVASVMKVGTVKPVNDRRKPVVESTVINTNDYDYLTKYKDIFEDFEYVDTVLSKKNEFMLILSQDKDDYQLLTDVEEFANRLDDNIHMCSSIKYSLSGKEVNLDSDKDGKWYIVMNLNVDNATSLSPEHRHSNYKYARNIISELQTFSEDEEEEEEEEEYNPDDYDF